MKVLITGGAGYIGGTVTRLLLARGHSVTVFDNLCHSKRLAVAEAASFVEGDVADRVLLEKTLTEGQFDGVMHFAALIEAGESMKRPEVYFRNNSAATLTLLEEEGFATVAAADGNKKLYAATEQGKECLNANRVVLKAIFGRMEQAGKVFGRGRSPQIKRAIMNLKFALKMRVERGDLSAEQVAKIAEAMDAAARAIDEA